MAMAARTTQSEVSGLRRINGEEDGNHIGSKKMKHAGGMMEVQYKLDGLILNRAKDIGKNFAGGLFCLGKF